MVVRATEEHARQLAPNIRKEVAAEIFALRGQTPLESLLESMRAPGGTAWAILLGGEVAGLFGVAPLNVLAGIACIWLLSGDLIASNPYTFLRACRPAVRAMLEDWTTLANIIDARFEKAIVWARWMGFEVREARPYGVNGLPFHPIIIRRK